MTKDQDRKQEQERLAQDYEAYLGEHFDERELRLIANCCTYAANDPAGLPGHNLMIIVAKLANLMGIDDAGGEDAP